MEPEGSSAHSKVPATCPQTEPVRAPKSHLLKIRFNTIACSYKYGKYADVREVLQSHSYTTVTKPLLIYIDMFR
jgi:hypothetical protein